MAKLYHNNEYVGGQDDYNNLTSRPQINSVTLTRNKNSISDLFIPGKLIATTTSGIYGEIFNDYSDNEASGEYSHAEGVRSTASGVYSHTEGFNTIASGTSSHAEGHSSNSTGYGSHAEGSSTASGEYSHSEGRESISSGTYSHVEGYRTTATQEASHAEGNGADATGLISHAEGYITTASGDYSHAEGVHNTASGQSSHVECSYNTSSGWDSHAEGFGSVAQGDFSHAGGNHTIAGYTAQTTIGKFNNNQTTTLFEVGNGTSVRDRKNAFEVHTDGHINVNGDIYQNGVKLNLDGSTTQMYSPYIYTQSLCSAGSLGAGAGISGISPTHSSIGLYSFQGVLHPLVAYTNVSSDTYYVINNLQIDYFIRDDGNIYYHVYNTGNKDISNLRVSLRLLYMGIV